MIEKKISQFHFYGKWNNLDFRKIESAIAGQCFNMHWITKYYTQKWLVFKQEKQSFAMMMQYLNGPTLLSKAKKAKQPLP